MAKKLFYSMGEVSELFDVNPSLIRYWESKFSILKPQKNKKGNRLFSPEDVENLKLIYHLVKERGMTLEGAQRALQGGTARLTNNVELLEHLQSIRAQLLEVRNYLKDAGSDENILDNTVAVSTSSSSCQSPYAIDTMDANPSAEPVPEITAEHIASQEPLAKPTDEAKPQERELFAFYEQSLFN
jgi:DNA-binding transcriptional MerR regulator